MLDEKGLEELTNSLDLCSTDINEIQKYFKAKERFRIGPYFVAVLDDEETQHKKGTNYNIKRGWDVGGATLIFLSSRLTQQERDRVLAHEINEDLEYCFDKSGDVSNAHEQVNGSTPPLQKVLEKLERYQKEIGFL